MEILNRRILIFPMIPVAVLALYVPVVSDRTEAGEPALVPLAAAAPADPLKAPQTWVDDLAHRLTTYFTKKYPAYDFAPYTEELNRIRGAVTAGDRWRAKREMGVFLKMLASRAYGLGDDAAEELADLSRHMMPEEEFGIVYPESEPEPSAAGHRAAFSSAHSNEEGRT